MPTLSGTAIRRVIIEQAHRARQGHIGSALAVADILAVLYGGVLKESDLFVMSKGHAALALYAALHLSGKLPDLDDYCADGSLLGVHPDHNLPGVSFSTGSLGHGLSWAAGAALAARLRGSDRQVYVLMSDAELNEGSVWEAAMFAAHHHLENLIAIVDVDGQQALGYTSEILKLAPLRLKWEMFEWQTCTVDGHDEIFRDALRHWPYPHDAPRVVLAQTVFGKGIDFMESQIAWHYQPLTDDQYARAMTQLA